MKNEKEIKNNITLLKIIEVIGGLSIVALIVISIINSPSFLKVLPQFLIITFIFISQILVCKYLEVRLNERLENIKEVETEEIGNE